MKDRQHVAWLYEQLPVLVSEGVLAPDVAARLQQRYGTADAQAGRRWARVLFSILGAALVGGGIILLLAHNWDALSRPLRVAIALAPLLVSQVLAGWVMWSQHESLAWREGIGTFLTLSIGMSIALVSQTYHLNGDLGDFLLVWGLLGLPVAYLLQATVPALLYVIDITVWTGTVGHAQWQALGYWPLLLAFVPYLWRAVRRHRYQARTVLICWVVGITVPLALGLSLHRVIEASAAWLLFYSALAGVMYLSGARLWSAATTTWQRPWQTLGGLGVVGLALVFSFEEAWKGEMHLAYWRDLADTSWPALVACSLAVLWTAAAVLLWADSVLRRRLIHSFLGAMPLVVMAGYALVNARQSRLAGALLFNAYLLVLGIGVLVAGLRARRLGVVNGGMLVLAAVLVSRFLDADLGFVGRGIVFIVLGLGFLATNMVLMRRQGAQP